jgi:dethiobiotin synthetase
MKGNKESMDEYHNCVFSACCPNIQTVNFTILSIDLIEHGKVNVNGIIMTRSNEKGTCNLWKMN